MNTTELKNLRRKLPKNSYTRLSEATGLSKSFVVKVMRGERSSQVVVDAAQTLADEYEKNVRENIINSISQPQS